MKFVLNLTPAPGAVRKSPSPIKCRGYEIHNSNARDYDCEYEFPPECERCVVNAGPIDPRTGRRYRKEKP